MFLPKTFKMKRICLALNGFFPLIEYNVDDIAKGIQKNYNVRILTFDKSKSKDTSVYELDKLITNYKFVSFPSLVL